MFAAENQGRWIIQTPFQEENSSCSWALHGIGPDRKPRSWRKSSCQNSVSDRWQNSDMSSGIMAHATNPLYFIMEWWYSRQRLHHMSRGLTNGVSAPASQRGLRLLKFHDVSYIRLYIYTIYSIYIYKPKNGSYIHIDDVYIYIYSSWIKLCILMVPLVCALSVRMWPSGAQALALCGATSGTQPYLDVGNDGFISKFPYWGNQGQTQIPWHWAWGEMFWFWQIQPHSIQLSNLKISGKHGVTPTTLPLGYYLGCVLQLFLVLVTYHGWHHGARCNYSLQHTFVFENVKTLILNNYSVVWIIYNVLWLYFIRFFSLWHSREYIYTCICM